MTNKPNMQFHPCVVSLPGESWEWDESEMTVGDWRKIKQATGLARLAFIRGIVEEDPDAVQGLVWYLRDREKPGYKYEWAAAVKPSELDYHLVSDADPSGSAVSAGTIPPETETTTSSTSTPSAA